MAPHRYRNPLTVTEAKAQVHGRCTWLEERRKKGMATRNAERVFATVVTVDGPSTRDMAEILDLAPSTVGSVVRQLEEQKLVRIGAGRAAAQGRRPRPVYVDDHTRHIIGFEIFSDRVVGVVMNLAGIAVLHETAPVEPSRPSRPSRTTRPVPVEEDAVVETVRSLFTSLKGQLTERSAATNSGLDPLLGVGVGLGGHINRHTGEVLFSPDLRWGERKREKWTEPVRLAQRIKDVTGVRQVVLDNDANARGALHRLYGGAAAFDTESVTVVLVTEVGIGAAHFIDGELHRGASGKSFELGNLHITRQGRQCRCGDRGCLEAMATGDALLEPARAGTLEDARKLAAEGEEHAVRAFAEAGDYLGIGLSIVVDLVDTARIVLTGPAITRDREDAPPKVFNEIYHRAMTEALLDHCYARGFDLANLEVVEEAGEWNGARGAAALVVHDMIAGHITL